MILFFFYPGVLGAVEPHQSISNLVVKHCSGEDTLEAALRENSSMPGSTYDSFLEMWERKELVAQWNRARGYEPLGRGFDSLQARSTLLIKRRSLQSFSSKCNQRGKNYIG